MKQFVKKGLILSSLVALALAGCKSKETPDDPNRIKEVALDHLIIKEVFSTGTWHQRGKSGYKYDEDAYIKIYNPTKNTLYLDSLALITTGFSSAQQLELNKDCDFRQTHVAVNRMIQFPGTGKEYPIEPGKEVLIARVAVDHTQKTDLFDGNPNSLDLTKANFEWMTAEQIEEDGNHTENINVPNLITVYSGGSEFFDGEDDKSSPLSLSQSPGLLALVKLGVSSANLNKEQYKWECSWNTGIGGHGHGSNGTYLKIPNEWIIDAVNICPKDAFKWHIVNNSIDSGYTAVVKEASKENPKSNALVRKHDGKNFVDTNNSTVDFEETTPSVTAKN